MALRRTEQSKAWAKPPVQAELHPSCSGGVGCPQKTPGPAGFPVSFLDCLQQSAPDSAAPRRAGEWLGSGSGGCTRHSCASARGARLGDAQGGQLLLLLLAWQKMLQQSRFFHGSSGLWYPGNNFEHFSNILLKKKKRNFLSVSPWVNFSVFSLCLLPLLAPRCSLAQIALLVFPDWEKALFRK